ncbi:helix-turn-helix domain-containing protein [Stenotrophomonas nitritireducens]|jgi:transcriptional regulator with XRE-family HTH domain
MISRKKKKFWGAFLHVSRLNPTSAILMGFPWGVRVTLSVDSTPTFARRLQQARLHTGLSQKELGIRAGLDPYVASPRVNQYERGKHEPKLETAERLAQALGIPAAFLYTDDDLLAKLLLRWGSLSKQQKRELVKLIEATPEK